jgi:hypothetical protein
LDSDHLKTVAGERLFKVIAFQVFGWMPCDGDIIVIDDDFYVQVLRNGQASRLGVVAFLLRTIGAKTEDSLVTIGKGDAIDHGPQMSETTGREFDARRETKLGVTRELRVGGAILQEVVYGEVTFERCDEVLCCDAVAWAGTSMGEQPRNKEDDKPASSKTIG